jgi:hypothetical protein
MMNETIKATGTPCPRGNNTVGKAFGENPLPTSTGFAAKAANSGQQFHRPTGEG